MILLAVWLTAITLICYLIGRWGLHGLIHIFGGEAPQAAGFGPLVLIGLTLIVSVANLVSIGIPLGFGAALGLVAIAALAGWFERGAIRQDFARLTDALRQTSVWMLVLGAAFCAVLIYKSSDLPINYDTGLYHAQTMRWIETYPVVPGLGNFADRLAFDSSWLVFGALVSASWLGNVVFHAPASLLFLLLVIEGCWRLGRLLRGEVRIAHVLAVLFLLLGRRLFPLEFSSPGTDLPAALLIWLAGLYALDLLESGALTRLTGRHWAILLGTVLAVTVKLSALPALILPAYIFLRLNKNARLHPAWSGLALAALLAVPWLARNVIVSGYLAYPFPQVDLFALDWKIPVAKALEAQSTITAWARLPNRDAGAVLAMPLSQWAPMWWKEQDSFDQLLLIGAGAAWLLLAFRWIVARIRRSPWRVCWEAIPTVAATGAAGCIFWFLQAPSFRFGYGFIGVLLGCPLAVLAAEGLVAIPRRWRQAGLVLVLVGLLAYQAVSLAGLRNVSEWQARWWIPAGYPAVEVNQVKQNNFSYAFPRSGNQCWDAPIPCTPFPNQQSWMRGTDFSQGFRTQAH
jgi:hypothetical protein